MKKMEVKNNTRENINVLKDHRYAGRWAVS